MTPAEQRVLVWIQTELGRVIRYDDESILNDHWLRQRYDSRGFASYEPARKAAVRTAWHEAGHAVAALAVGARFTSASIHHGRDSAGRVHGIQGTGELAFAVAAAGQIAERLMDWTMLEDDEELRAWLPRWKSDGGDASRFRRTISQRFGNDEFAAWRYSEETLLPLRLTIRQVARALLVHPRHLPYEVVAALTGEIRSAAVRRLR
jgi:hypothetical protein